MDKKPENMDLIDILLLESESYASCKQLESLSDISKDLTSMPLQPLYRACKNGSLEELVSLLPMLSSEQRQGLLDIDNWERDCFDVEACETWLKIYASLTDEDITLEFIESEDFALFLKGRFNVSTFDLEDPQYPEGNNFFITEDQLLLFEYESDYPYVDEVKLLLKKLYAELGVEKAYAYLFKIVVDSYMVLLEENYKFKKNRLDDFGIVDYFDALPLLATFPSMQSLENFVQNKKGISATIDSIGKNQILHVTSLIAYKEKMEGLHQELGKVKDNHRSDYLHFNFIKLVNSTVTLKNAMKEGQVALTRIGNETRSLMNLGLDYILKCNNISLPEEGVFKVFDFFDLYKIGNTLISLERNKLNSCLKDFSSVQADKETFLGNYWNNFIDCSFENPPQFRNEKQERNIVDNMLVYKSWQNQVGIIQKLIPFIKTFYKTYADLCENNLLKDEYYINYKVADIDFESLIISSFINFDLGLFTNQNSKKMGVTINELKTFYKNSFYLTSKDNNVTQYSLNIGPNLKNKLEAFAVQFGLSEIEGVGKYLEHILDEQMSGYPIDQMKEEEFKHVGGPVLLNTLN